MLVAIGVFAVVFVILAKAVWPKILGGLKDRENKIREEIEGAELARQQAKDALEQYQQSLAQARAEAQKMIETTKAQQATLAAELRAKADTKDSTQCASGRCGTSKPPSGKKPCLRSTTSAPTRRARPATCSVVPVPGPTGPAPRPSSTASSHRRGRSR